MSRRDAPRRTRRLRNGQIDLVMLDREQLVMVEVKARRGANTACHRKR